VKGTDNVCTTDPEVPLIESAYAPAAKKEPLTVRVTVAGKLLTDAGLTLQLPAPYVAGQVNVTVPPNPSCEAMEIGPFTPVLPALTAGNALGSLNTKSGFAVTTKLNEVVKGAAAPLVVACRVTGYVPAAVPAGTAMLAVMFTGDPDFGFTVAPGVRLQVALGMDEVHETVTLWLNDPAAVT
jgi:hypothetical protein